MSPLRRPRQERLTGCNSSRLVSRFSDYTSSFLLTSQFADCTSSLLMSRSKFRQPHGRGREMLSELQTQIPEPLIHNVPELLTTGGARTPTICVLFSILVREDGLKCAPMQVESKDISTGEGSLRCGREKQFIHCPSTQNPNGWFVGRCGRVGRNDQPNTRS